MLEFISSLPTFDEDFVTKSLWEKIEEYFSSEEGVCYYKHPVLGTTTGVMADLTLFTIRNQPIAIRCLPYEIEDIQSINEDFWGVQQQKIDSPSWELDDFAVALQRLIDLDRRLRRRLSPKAILALPLISESDFNNKFGEIPTVPMFWRGDDVSRLRIPLGTPLNPDEWKAFRAVIQTATPLTHPSPSVASEQVTTLGSAIRVLGRQIKTLDFDQEKVATQIAPGPQRIRGLAGTGKTVLLAMKIANIHRHFPTQKILFTFNTRSLYNQTRNLIEEFYRVHNTTEPDWTVLHIRHAWGARNRPGVYSDLCGRQGVDPLNFQEAKRINPINPFQACCEQALNGRIEPEYDFIVVDEAQDFPKEFFRVLYKLSSPERHIYWAYDELQSLASSSLEMPSPEELFGRDETGKPLVVLDDKDYPGKIPKDFTLSKSYRCPENVLMLAHAIGLGLYNPKGVVQMLENKASWGAIGYIVEQGDFNVGERVTVFRPPENSPNKIAEIYKGEQPLIVVKDFEQRSDELDWVANSIANDIQEENVAPEHIVVIILDALKVKEYSPLLQRRLVERSVASTIPGLIDDVDTYAEAGRVTLSSVFRAKGK